MGKKKNEDGFNEEDFIMMAISSNSKLLNLTIQDHLPIHIYELDNLDVKIKKGTKCTIKLEVPDTETIEKVTFTECDEDITDDLDFTFKHTGTKVISEENNVKSKHYLLTFKIPNFNFSINFKAVDSENNGPLIYENTEEEEKEKKRLMNNLHTIYVSEKLRGLKLYTEDERGSLFEIINTNDVKGGERITILVDKEQNAIVKTIFIREYEDRNKDVAYIHSYDDIRHHMITFVMPSTDILIEDISFIDDPNGIVDYFEIPDELAKELSDNLIKQTIRQRTLAELVNDPDRYNAAEKLLVPIVTRIEAIKVQITNQYVPIKYRSSEYMWNYDGYEIDGNHVQIHKIS